MVFSIWFLRPQRKNQVLSVHILPRWSQLFNSLIMAPCRREEIVSVAGDQHLVSLAGKPHDVIVRHGGWQHSSQEMHFVVGCHERICKVIGHIVVEEELHRVSTAICRATNKSISPRWSS